MKNTKRWVKEMTERGEFAGLSDEEIQERIFIHEQEQSMSDVMFDDEEVYEANCF